MIYLSLALKGLLGMIIAAIVLWFQPPLPGSSMGMYVVFFVGCIFSAGGAAIIVGILQDRRQGKRDAASERDKRDDTLSKTAGIESLERQDARHVMLDIVTLLKEQVANYAAEKVSEAEFFQRERERIAESHRLEIAGLVSSINLLREAVAAKEGQISGTR